MNDTKNFLNNSGYVCLSNLNQHIYLAQSLDILIFFRPFIFMLKFLRKISHFLQSTIENHQKGHYLMSRSTPGTFCVRTRSSPSTL